MAVSILDKYDPTNDPRLNLGRDIHRSFRKISDSVMPVVGAVNKISARDKAMELIRLYNGRDQKYPGSSGEIRAIEASIADVQAKLASIRSSVIQGERESATEQYAVKAQNEAIAANAARTSAPSQAYLENEENLGRTGTPAPDLSTKYGAFK